MDTELPFEPDLCSFLRLRRRDELSFDARVPAGWQQGRGAFGGLVLGLLMRAMEEALDAKDRTLRSMSGEILAPVVAGDAELVVEVLRAGSRVTSLSARLAQQGELRAHAHGLFGRQRVSERDQVQVPPPELKDWRGVEIIPVEPPFGPAFARAFEFRPTSALPFSGAASPEASGWIRLKQRPSTLGMPELVAYADAWWPSALAREPEPRPMATIAFSLQLFVDPATLDPELPFFHRTQPLAAHEGYACELRELWTPDGRLVTLNPQTFAIIA